MAIPGAHPLYSLRSNIVAQLATPLQVIQLIRHGKGFHNDLPDQSMYLDWIYEDAHLTDLCASRWSVQHNEAASCDKVQEVQVGSHISHLVGSACTVRAA